MVTKNICIFCSANDISQVYVSDAQELVKLMVQNNYNLVWGGSNVGLMKEIADAVQNNGGKISGVTMELLKDSRRLNADEMTITKDLSERKKVLLEKSDAIVLLVGGIGSLDEVTEILELKKHDLHQKPIVVLNTNNFYAGLKTQFEAMRSEGFISKPLDDLIYFADTPSATIEYINNHITN